jgi:biopolymer transport protein ExbD
MLVEKRKAKPSEIPTSSLADIAFLLLVFFLVTTTIDVDKGIGLVLPPKGEELKKEISKKNIANLLINAEGKVMIDEQIYEIPMIRDIIKKKITDNPKIIVSVKTDENTKYQYYIQVLDQLKLADAKKISIAEPEK